MSANRIQHIVTFIFYIVLAVLVGIWIYKSKWLELFVFCTMMGILHVHSWYRKREEQERDEERNRKAEKESDSQQLVD